MKYNRKKLKLLKDIYENQFDQDFKKKYKKYLDKQWKFILTTGLIKTALRNLK